MARHASQLGAMMRKWSTLGPLSLHTFYVTQQIY